ncbi:ATP-binding protein [Brasilonema sennae]|nr:ATP-binding protein [Brasilonema sennae]
MQRPQPETVTLDDVVITEELSRRTPRPPNLLSENQGLHALARQLVNQPEIMLQNLVDMALDLCTAQSVGVSLLQTTPSGEEVFGWIVLAGTLKQYVGNTAPRNFSPCGTCLDRGTPQLYSYPGRYFTYFQEAEAQIVESLVLPLTADNHALGTIWIVSHDEQRHFDSEDVRVMTSLADFTAAALLLNQRQTRELLAANAALEAEIIERKRSQEALRENDAYLKSLVNLVPDMLWRNDVTGNTSWYNQRWLDYTGQTMEEAQGYGWLEVIDPEDRAQSLANFQNAVNERRLLRQEHRIRGTDGNYRWFLIQASPVFDARGCIIQWFGTATDIHEQRTVLETLRESEERLQLAADAATFGTYEYIPQTDQINWSTTLKAIHGLLEDAEITFARLSEFIHPDDQEQTLGKFHQFLSPDAPGPYEHEFRIVRTDGAVRWVLDKGQVFFTGEGEHRRVDRAIGVTLDITDRKLSEAALHESEQRLRTLIENLPGGAAFVVDRNLRYLLAEGEALYAAGFKREDLVGKTIFEAMPPELTAKYEELYRMALLGESFEHEHNAHDHSYISRGTPLRTKSGEVYAVLAVSYDISDRKKAEVALRESEERFRLFVTASSDIIYRMSADWSQMRNLEGKNILASTENPSHTWLETYIPKEEQPQVWAVIQEAIRTKSTFELEHRVIEQDGTIGWTFSRAIPMLNEQGEIIEWFGAASDVTDRKQTEAAIAQDLKDTQLLRDLSARLVTEGNIQALYQEIMATAIALTRADAGTVQILDEATQELVLLATQDFERNMIEHFYRVNASSNTPCGIALVTGERTFVDFDVPENEDPDGSCRVHVEAGYLCAHSTPLIARSGKAIGMFSTHWRKHYRPSDRELRFLDLLARQAADLIEQRQVQVALRESEEKYRTLFNSIDEGFCIFELIEDDEGNAVDWIYLEANPAFEQQTGFINPIGKRIREFQPDLERLWFERFAGVARTGQPMRFVQYTEAMGIWYDVYALPVGVAGDNRVSLLFTDITDRKRREANLAFLAGLMNDFAPLATAKEIMEMAGKRIAEHLDLSRYMFVEIYPEAGTCTYLLPSRPAGQLEIRGSYILADYHTEEEHRLLSTGHSMVMNDVRDGTRSPEQIAAFEAFDIASIVNTPYLSNGRWVFDLGVARSKPSVWREDEIELLREISGRVWLRIERARTEVDLRQSEEKYRSLFNSMDEGYFLCDVIFDETDQPTDLFYIDENPAAVRMTGQSFRGQRLREINPNYEEYWYEIFGRVAQTGQAERLERYAAPNQIWYDFYVFKVGCDDTRRVAVVFNDITDRKRAEEQLRYAAETDAFRLKLSDALRPLSDPVAMQETAMQTLGAYLNVNRAFYGEVLDDDDTLVIGSGYADGLSPIVAQIKFSEFDSDLLTDYRAGRTVVINDLYVDMQLSAKAKTEFDAIQVRAAVGVALLKNEKVRAILSIHQSVPRQWTPSEIALLEETADRTWAAVERARAEAALRESEMQRVREQSVLEQERQRAESLAELDRAKTTFFSNVSHEFRTPLTLLLAPLQDALNDRTTPLAPPQRERLELAHRNTNRLRKLVNTLLDFSRIEAGRMEAVYEATDLALLTTELASVFRSAIERAGVRLIVDCPPLPEPVYVDREMWEKIVLNLVSNAFKFTFEGEIAVRLHLADQRHVKLQVEDTGTGISPEELPHLFERFYQIRGTKARTHQGSGIGLALVHELIRLNGGTVDVSSTIGQGTCFTVTIPLGTAHLPNDRISATRTQASTGIGADPYVQEAERWLPEEGNRERLTGNREQGAEEGGESAEEITPSSPSSPLSPSPRILLVDDNADMRDYLTRILSEHVQVQAVGDGAAALAAAQERVPDLVLSDVMMPQLDGLELLKALRAEACTREVPIILLSARAGVESVVEGLEAGADDYLIKPFSATELVSRVNAHLQMAHLRLEALRQERTTSRRKDEMLSIVSHELNTPLVAILGWTRLLRANPPSHSMLMKSLETIERNATLQAKLISDLLDISRITAGKLHLNLEPVELQSVIETAIATVHQTQKTKDIELTCLLDPLPIIVQGDLDRLQQIVLNLLTNSIKFTPKAGRIEIRLDANETQAQIKVSDTGCGISAEFLPHVFDSFRQAESSKSQSIKGLGLGLAIARHLVELHGGTIYAESPGFGQGATFTVNLALISVSF